MCASTPLNKQICSEIDLVSWKYTKKGKPPGGGFVFQKKIWKHRIIRMNGDIPNIDKNQR